ncbi:PQQ-dependent sugar dehydrogenase [Lysobacter arvi]|uniref:PQQ-dependent sugar dehydrogenase n=1 Tax=Lysobacter arvi TaxID=3038776 RepID=A0ABU1CC61_9GAMM|nr:PQQ-dependent sugar dehydrogenase [Lysobacter arvi]MDR0182774.1 PQQ-dependent sugar dehydrogenase [Lysobacter arvi]
MEQARLAAIVLLTAMLAACGGGGDDDGSTPIPGAPVDRAPTFTSASAATVPEGTAGIFYTATATDPEGKPVSYTLSGGADQARFLITAAGALQFLAPPDFEAPADANADNVYLVSITASDGTQTATLPLSVTVTDVTGAQLRVRRVASGLSFPIFLAPVPDTTGRVFVVERAGRVRLLSPGNGAIATTPFLDLTGQVSTDGERGLLGFATAPDFGTSGRFYVYLTVPDGTIELRRYQTLANNRDQADPASGDAILRIAHPRSNHNGGWIGFGPDGMLYVAVGDGGGTGDPDDNAQNRATLLGKILRIDPASDAFPSDANRDYAIPAGNPFTAPNAPEVWAYGLRNPFRNSFDPLTGHLYIGDVGQGAIEEIDLARAGEAGLNFGWPILEGTQAYRGGSTAGLAPPIAEYAHGTGAREGESVTGGVVYRGPLESLRGEYLFGDFVQPNLWSIQTGVILQGSTIPSTRFQLRNADFTPTAGTIDNVVAFGTDTANNVYIVDFDGDIFVIEPVPGTGGALSIAQAAPASISAPVPAMSGEQAMSREQAMRRAREALLESLRRR